MGQKCVDYCVYLWLCAIRCSGSVGLVNEIKHSTVSPLRKTGVCSRISFALISIMILNFVINKMFVYLFCIFICGQHTTLLVYITYNNTFL